MSMQQSVFVSLQRMALFSGRSVVDFLEVNEYHQTNKDSEESAENKERKGEKEEFRSLIVATKFCK